MLFLESWVTWEGSMHTHTVPCSPTPGERASVSIRARVHGRTFLCIALHLYFQQCNHTMHQLIVCCIYCKHFHILEILHFR